MKYIFYSFMKPPVFDNPPSTQIDSPVMNEDKSDDRNPITLATSSGKPIRFNGYILAIFS
jgi:hypothetical protein